MPFDAKLPIDSANRNNEFIDEFTREYRLKKEPVEVNFRKLIPEIRGPERSTHLIHSYPAKLIPQIPYLFLNNTRFSERGDVVLDPFCGSGTVLLESILAGRIALGCDANPLARLITSAKTTSIHDTRLTAALKRIQSGVKRMRSRQTPVVVNQAYWFPLRTSWMLGRILSCIEDIDDQPVREFMLVAFSNCVKKVSRADPRVSVPVRLNAARYKNNSARQKQVLKLIRDREQCNVLEKFSDQVRTNITRLKTLALLSQTESKIVSRDAGNLTASIDTDAPLASGSVKLIITSPPYAGAQKYIRSSSLSLGWLRMASPSDLRELDRKTIGRESFRKGEITIKTSGIRKADQLIEKLLEINPTRAFVVYSYLTEMRRSIREMVRALAPGGHVVMVIGNNRMCGLEFDAQDYLTKYFEREGMRVRFKLIDDIRSYGLMTKRNKTADIISREWVVVLEKPSL